MPRCNCYADGLGVIPVLGDVGTLVEAFDEAHDDRLAIGLGTRGSRAVPDRLEWGGGRSATSARRVVRWPAPARVIDRRGRPLHLLGRDPAGERGGARSVVIFEPDLGEQAWTTSPASPCGTRASADRVDDAVKALVDCREIAAAVAALRGDDELDERCLARITAGSRRVRVPHLAAIVHRMPGHVAPTAARSSLGMTMPRAASGRAT